MNRPCIYSICDRNEVTSSSDGDADRNVIIRKLLNYIFSVVLTLLSWWEIQTHLKNTVFRVVMEENIATIFRVES
jgi:hypothetical protein